MGPHQFNPPDQAARVGYCRYLVAHKRIIFSQPILISASICIAWRARRSC